MSDIPLMVRPEAMPAVTLNGLLHEMVEYDAVARWPEPAFTVRQASSYDRSRIAPDQPGWFANNDGSNYIRTETHAGRERWVLGTLIGAFIIAVIQNGMNLMNVEAYTQKVILGLVILGAVLLDMVRRGRRSRPGRITDRNHDCGSTLDIGKARKAEVS